MAEQPHSPPIEILILILVVISVAMVVLTWSESELAACLLLPLACIQFRMPDVHNDQHDPWAGEIFQSDPLAFSSR